MQEHAGLGFGYFVTTSMQLKEFDSLYFSGGLDDTTMCAMKAEFKTQRAYIQA